MYSAPLFWNVFILLFMYSSQLGNTSGKASFQSQLRLPGRASHVSLSVWISKEVMWLHCGRLLSDLWPPALRSFKVRLLNSTQNGVICHLIVIHMTWKSFVPPRCLREPRSLSLFSSVFICCCMSTFYTHAREPLCVSKKRGCSRSPGCGRAPCVLWRGQDFRFMAFNKLPFRIKATSKRCLMFKGLSCYQQQHKQQQVVRKAFEPLWTQMPPIHTHTHTLKRWPSDPLTPVIIMQLVERFI